MGIEQRERGQRGRDIAYRRLLHAADISAEDGHLFHHDRIAVVQPARYHDQRGIVDLELI